MSYRRAGKRSGEGLCSGQDSGHHFKSSQPVTGFGELDQAMFAPLFVAGVHGFRDSVREEYEQVSRFKRNRFLLIALPYDADHWTAGLQAQDLASRTRFAQDHRWVVTRVDIGKLAASGIVLGVEKSGVAVRRGRLVDAVSQGSRGV